jgi:FdhD protein
VFGDLMEEIDSIRCATTSALRETLYGSSTRYGATRPSTRARRGARLRARGGTEIVHFVEDVGRHNAVDAIAG